MQDSLPAGGLRLCREGALETWLRAKLALISQKIKIAEAIRHALSRWQGADALHR
jgi:hypothetical protein